MSPCKKSTRIHTTAAPRKNARSGWKGSLLFSFQVFRLPHSFPPAHWPAGKILSACAFFQEHKSDITLKTFLSTKTHLNTLIKDIKFNGAHKKRIDHYPTCGAICHLGQSPKNYLINRGQFYPRHSQKRDIDLSASTMSNIF